MPHCLVFTSLLHFSLFGLTNLVSSPPPHKKQVDEFVPHTLHANLRTVGQLSSEVEPFGSHMGLRWCSGTNGKSCQGKGLDMIPGNLGRYHSGAVKFTVSHGIIEGKRLQFSGTNFVDKTLKPPESTYKTTFLVLSRIWNKICTRAWSPFPLIIHWKTMQVARSGIRRDSE